MRKSVTHIVAVFGTALSTSGCVGALIAGELLNNSLAPELAAGDEFGATVMVYNDTSDQKALEIANQHCAKYRKHARAISRGHSATETGGSIVYSCV